MDIKISYHPLRFNVNTLFPTVMTSTTMRDRKWDRLVKSDPQRVVAVFDMKPGARATNRWGDTLSVRPYIIFPFSPLTCMSAID